VSPAGAPSFFSSPSSGGRTHERARSPDFSFSFFFFSGSLAVEDALARSFFFSFFPLFERALGDLTRASSLFFFWCTRRRWRTRRGSARELFFFFLFPSCLRRVRGFALGAFSLLFSSLFFSKEKSRPLRSFFFLPPSASGAGLINGRGPLFSFSFFRNRQEFI